MGRQGMLLALAASLVGMAGAVAGGHPTLAAAAPGVPTDPVSQQIIDSYDPQTNRLTIPLVQVGARYYRDVVITVGSLVSVGVAEAPSGVFDRYEVGTNQLTIPVIRVGSALYYNVVITVGSLVSNGGAVDSYSVPVDLAQVTYPQSYRTVTADEADINTDPCNLDLSTITYPATWLGQFPLPAITGAPLKPGTKRAVTLKDIGLQPGNPAFILGRAPGAPNGCTGDLHAALVKTVNRLRALGTDYVNITQWHWLSGRPDGSWYVTRAEDTFGSITDADLAFFVQSAHAAGLKVIVKNQIQGYLDMATSAITIPAATAQNYQKWFAAYHEYILDRAVFFEGLGVDVWELGCNSCIYNDVGDGSPEAVETFYLGYQTALDLMKAHFTGKVSMGTAPWLYQKPLLASRLDIFEFGFYGPGPAIQAAGLTVEAYRDAVANSWLQSGIDLYDGFGKMIMVSYGIQSRQNMFTLPGYVEETVCTAALGDLNPSPYSCIQREAVTDFSMQAIVHEATLEALNQLTMNSTLIVSVGDYWETDSVMPFTAFPNLAFSIRNKPAEGIVKAWFAR